MIDLGFPEIAAILRDDAEVAVAIFERRGRREEVARVGETERADRPKIRQPHVLPVVLADVSARRSIWQLDAKFDTARHEDYMTGRDVEHAELGVHGERAGLRNDQQLTVSVVEEPVRHRPVGRVYVNSGACLHGRIAVAAERHDAVNEVGRFGGNRQRTPPHLVRRRRHFVERTAANQPIANLPEWLVHGRGPDAIRPG